jgi:hypothetical protein
MHKGTENNSAGLIHTYVHKLQWTVPQCKQEDSKLHNIPCQNWSENALSSYNLQHTIVKI